MVRHTFILAGICGVLLQFAVAALHAQQLELPASITSAGAAKNRSDEAPSNVLSLDEWAQVDAAVARSLAWLATQQQPDGSLPTMDHAQPAVTSLCVLAFMAHGHNPGEGPYGQRLERAVDFIMSCQKQNGLVARIGPEGQQISRGVAHEIGTSVAYNHAIASLTLSEIFGMGQSKRAERIQLVINRSLLVTLAMQRWRKDRPYDRGGWRYLDDDGSKDSDLSVTGWQLMFLRSARNAGFDVPRQPIDDAIDYVRRSFDDNYGAFNYTINRKDGPSRGMAGAGILALGHAGFHDSPEARRTGEWIMQYSFDVYNDNLGLNGDRYHYSLFMCCQGMYQLGSPYWEEFFPRTARAVLANQRVDGAWDAESFHHDRPFGNSYTTALVVLSLAAPNQLLPIFQR